MNFSVHFKKRLKSYDMFRKVIFFPEHFFDNNTYQMEVSIRIIYLSSDRI